MNGSSSIIMSAFIAAALLLPAAAPAQPKSAQTAAPPQPRASTVLQNKDVTVEYVEPRYETIYQTMKSRQVLEEVSALLSPLKLRHPLKIQLEDRDDICRSEFPNSYYDEKYTVHICYNWMDMLINGAAVKMYDDPQKFDSAGLSAGLMPGFTPAEVIVGGTVANLLHELGHALFHNLSIPRLGREEDAADQIAGLIMLQFGPSVAMPAIKGIFNAWHHMQATGYNTNKAGYIVPRVMLGDVHSVDLQRGLNYLCLAYGGPDSATFKNLADTWLADDRKANCAAEYKTAYNAFAKTFMPFVDQDKMKQVLQMQIFKPDDLQ